MENNTLLKAPLKWKGRVIVDATLVLQKSMKQVVIRVYHVSHRGCTSYISIPDRFAQI